MNKKVFISLLITAVLCLSMMTAAVFERAEALDVSVDKIFKILSGDTTEIEFDDEGVLITFPASAINASVSYVQPVSFEDFRFDFNANKKFDKLTFSFTDYTDSSNLAYLIIENDNGNIFAYVQKDSYDYMKTNLTDSLVPVVEGETGDEDMFAFSIEFKPFNEAAGVITSFKVNGLDVDSGNGRVTYAYNVVYMDIRMEKSEVNEDGDDTYLLAKSMMNKKGTQYFSKEADVVEILFWQTALSNMPEGVPGEGGYEGKTVYTYEGLYAKVSGEYTFPVYPISMVGDTSDVNTYVYVENEEEETGWELLSDAKRTVYTFGSEELLYKIVLTSSTEVHVLLVKSILDEVAPLFNEAILEVTFNTEMKDGVIYTKEGATFPDFKDEDGNFINNLFIFPEEDRGIDTVDNVAIRLGYKKPGSTSEWTWTSSFTPTLSTEGSWTFKYKVVDSSGNETESDIEFVRYVVDNTPPTISVTQNLTAYLGTVYTISAPTVTDTGVGVDTSKTSIRLFKGIRGSDNVEEIELSQNNKFIPDVLTGDEEDYTYFVEFKAYDYNGNEAETAYSYITVTEPVAEEEEGPDWVVIGLIAFSVVVIVVILVMIFYRPKEVQQEGSKKYIAKK